jgi:hypothetical protein
MVEVDREELAGKLGEMKERWAKVKRRRQGAAADR